MGTPEFIIALRKSIGHAPLWLMGATVICLRDGTAGPEILLVQRSDNHVWTTLSGIVDPGEHPAETARREAKEEAGVEVEVGRMLWTLVGERFAYDNGDVVQYLDHGFAGRVIGGEAHVADEESVDVGWFPIDALPEPHRDSLPRLIEIVLEDPRDVVVSLQP
ncbi:MAG: NUDIX domain-containing protein [Propionibacterium sp.]|nr:NUDIX domain-containing protein [Propionibacterium sp.]